MCALLDPEIRQWVDICAQYLTALGTIGAVVVALYLSGKDRREKISVSAAIHYGVGGALLKAAGPKQLEAIIPPGQTMAGSIRVFGVTATNVGFATVTVQKLCWRVGIFSKKVLHMLPLSGGEQPPKTLRRGDWLVNQGPLLELLDKHPVPSLALRSLRAGVETSTKKQFFARPNWDVAKIVREQFDTFIKSQPSSKS
jgi:hypothetical protein